MKEVYFLRIGVAAWWQLMGDVHLHSFTIRASPDLARFPLRLTHSAGPLCVWRMWVSTAGPPHPPVQGRAKRNRFTFAGKQSWVHSQGKHCSGCFPGHMTGSWFLVCRIWRTSSPCRVVRGGWHKCPSWDEHPAPPYAHPSALTVCLLRCSLSTARTVPILVYSILLPFSVYFTP